MTALRRRVRDEIAVRAEQIAIALEHSRVDLDQHALLAMLVLAVERLEAQHTHDKLRDFFEHVLTAPTRPPDPRADTRGT